MCFRNILLSDTCDGGVFKNPSGDRICWVRTNIKMLYEEGIEFCKEMGYQGFAEIRTREDDHFLAEIRACK